MRKRAKMLNTRLLCSVFTLTLALSLEGEGTLGLLQELRKGHLEGEGTFSPYKEFCEGLR